MSSSTSSLPTPFYFIESFHLLICSRHQIAIPYTQVFEHLRKHFTPYQINHHYQEIFTNLSISSISESHGLIRAVEPIQPISFLGQVRDGYTCGIPHCHHLALSLPNLRRHLRESHQKGGSTSQQAPYIESIPLQSLYHGQYLFTVLPLEVSTVHIIILLELFTNIYLYI